MKRHEFLKSIGFKGGALMALLGSCTKDTDSVLNTVASGTASTSTTTGSTTGTTTGTGTSTGTTTGTGTSTGTTTGTTTGNGTDLSTITNPLLKITLATYASTLGKVGGYIQLSGIVVAQPTAGVYVAATQTCSHEPKKKVIYYPALNAYYCTEHGAQFSLAGKGLNSFGSGGLTVYKTATDGITLVVYS